MMARASKKDNGKAHEWWEKASQAGSLSALSTIAMGYYEGSMGYPKDIKKAVDYLERSADVGNYVLHRFWSLSMLKVKKVYHLMSIKRCFGVKELMTDNIGVKFFSSEV